MTVPIFSFIGPFWIFHCFTTIGFCSALASVGFVVWNGESHIFFNSRWIWRHSCEILSSHLFPFRHYGHFNQRTNRAQIRHEALKSTLISFIEIWDFHISRTAYRTEFVLCSFQPENAVSIQCFIYYICLKWREMAEFCEKLKKVIAFFFRKMPYLKIG